MYDSPIYILGKSFKPETNIQTGSPSILLKNILDERGVICVMYDPYVDDINNYDFKKGVYFIGTMHPDFNEFDFPNDSIIIDPWRYVNDIDGVTIIRVGEGK